MGLFAGVNNEVAIGGRAFCAARREPNPAFGLTRDDDPWRHSAESAAPAHRIAMPKMADNGRCKRPLRRTLKRGGSAPTAISHFHPMRKRQPGWRIHQAVNQGLVLIAIGVGPKGAATVSLEWCSVIEFDVYSALCVAGAWGDLPLRCRFPNWDRR